MEQMRSCVSADGPLEPGGSAAHAELSVGRARFSCMIRYVVAIPIVLASWATTASSVIECKAELPPAAGEYWSWRIIDGKRCWYPGRPGMSKANLRWPQRELLPGELRQSEGFGQRAREEDEEVRNANPSKEQELPFAERWRGLHL
jgi:hypothetical protein